MTKQEPLEIVFQDMDPSDAIDARLREEGAKLELFSHRIASARVVVAKPHKQHPKGNTYRVRIHITQPGGGGIVVNRDPGDRESHFHRNSVANNGYGALKEGQALCFSESRGDEGPQASFVQPVGKHRAD